MLNVVLVDDEAKARKSLSLILARYPDIRIVAEAANGKEAIDVVAAHHPDIIFLDVKMPGMSGFDVLDTLNKNGNKSTKVVFLTAYDEFAIKAIKYAAFDYLLKPVDTAELDETMNRLQKSITDEHPDYNRLKHALEHSKKIRVKTSAGFEFIDCSEIIFIEGEGNYSIIVLSETERHTVSKTLKEMHSMLPETFVRIHRKYIINTLYSYSFRKVEYLAVLRKNEQLFSVPVSVRMFRKLRPMLNI